MIDVVTVGASSGSMASISPEGTLKVGPQTRRATGPDLYGDGGTEPTITDARVLFAASFRTCSSEVSLDVT